MTPSGAFALQALESFATSQSEEEARTRFRPLDEAVSAVCLTSQAHLRVVVNRIKVGIADLAADAGTPTGGYVREQLLNLLYRGSHCLAAAERAGQDAAQRAAMYDHYPTMAALARAGRVDLVQPTPPTGAAGGGVDPMREFLEVGLVEEVGDGMVEPTHHAIRLLRELGRQ